MSNNYCFFLKAIWLIAEYYLEFEGRNTMVYMLILWDFIRNHHDQAQAKQKAQ